MTEARGSAAGGRQRKWKARFFRLMSLYPPFLGAGIRIVHVASDLSSLEVRMKLTFWNRNYLGTQFGGSLYSLTDPFYMLLLLEALGPGYVVWDKEAVIRFKRPGRGTVRARFDLPPERVAEIRAVADAQYKTEPRFLVQVLAESGEVVAEVEKLLYVRRKDRTREERPSGGLP
jgi:acyl-coenzyme A thioesterase PaaI-like protein